MTTFHESPKYPQEEKTGISEVFGIGNARILYKKCLEADFSGRKFGENFKQLEKSGVSPKLIRSFASYATFNNDILDKNRIRLLVSQSDFTDDDSYEELVA